MIIEKACQIKNICLIWCCNSKIEKIWKLEPQKEKADLSCFGIMFYKKLLQINLKFFSCELEDTVIPVSKVPQYPRLPYLIMFFLIFSLSSYY